jgi:hypothetical protein
MSTQASETAVRNSIVVEAPVERAFSVFTDGFGTFKPREHNMLQVEIAETLFESPVGGHIYERWWRPSFRVKSRGRSSAGWGC